MEDIWETGLKIRHQSRAFNARPDPANNEAPFTVFSDIQNASESIVERPVHAYLRPRSKYSRHADACHDVKQGYQKESTCYALQMMASAPRALTSQLLHDPTHLPQLSSNRKGYDCNESTRFTPSHHVSSDLGSPLEVSCGNEWDRPNLVDVSTERLRPSHQHDAAQLLAIDANPDPRQITPGASSATNIDERSAAGSRSHFFVSRRVRKENIQRPWLDDLDPREKWLTIIPCVGIAIGLCIAVFLVWDGLQTVVNHSYCQILDEDFTNGLDQTIWTKEAEVGGFGNGQFEETTTGDENVYVDARDHTLLLRPTLQDTRLVMQNSTINLTLAGICSSKVWSDCVATTNTTNGTIVNPVKSARISTRNGPHIKYGRVEVTATLPAGDWLWPAIWMLPVKATYGPWPQSGEIDIMESRGNNYTYPLGGNNIMSSTLHWGPSPVTDAWWRSSSERTALHNTYTEGAHIFGLEWSESYIFTYVDNRLLQVLYFDFRGNLWDEGNFPPADANGTRFVDIWSQTGRPSTPFDQDFYLIINLAVGATNGWFLDGAAGKPWVDASKSARRDFWDAQNEWLPTWGDGAIFRISRVQMWQQQGYNGCRAK